MKPYGRLLFYCEVDWYNYDIKITRIRNESMLIDIFYDSKAYSGIAKYFVDVK